MFSLYADSCVASLQNGVLMLWELSGKPPVFSLITKPSHSFSICLLLSTLC